jgi:hypothetical protein
LSSHYENVADLQVVTSFTPRVHVRHIAVSFWYYPGYHHNNRNDLGPMCGLGSETSEYMRAGEEHAELPICRLCLNRLRAYVERYQNDGRELA